MLNNTDEIMQTCEDILVKVREKSKVEVNPLLIRIQSIIKEFQTHLLSLSGEGGDEKYHWGVLYRAGDTLDENAVLINHTTPVFIQTELDFIKRKLVLFTNYVVQKFGKRDSLYIITPKFQELAGLW
jgi:hypothetical protein